MGLRVVLLVLSLNVFDCKKGWFNSSHAAFFHFFFVCLFCFLLGGGGGFNQIFPKNLTGIPSECQTVWLQIRLDVLSGMNLVQTVCHDTSG